MGHKHLGAKSIDEYACLSNMASWNSGIKLLFSIIIMILSISSNNAIIPVFIAISAGTFTIIKGKIKISEYLSLLSIPLAFLIMGGITIAMEISFSHGFSVSFQAENIYKALCVSSKALGAVSAMYMLSLSTPVSEIIGVLDKLKVPSIIIELMHLIYRYIFILADTQARMKNSAVSRLGYKNFKTSIKSFGMIGGNLLVVSLHKASDYYSAIEARCFNGKIKFMTYKKAVKMKHLIFFISYTLIIIFAEILYRKIKL